MASQLNINLPRYRILNLLKEHGKTGGMIAARLKVSRQTVYDSMDGKGSRRVRVFVAKVVGISPHTLWKGLMTGTELAADDYEYLHRDDLPDYQDLAIKR